MTTMTEELAREIIRSRTSHHQAIQRPRHTRTARVLRGLAERLDRNS